MGTPGTFGNNSGLQQIPGGAKQIPQSFLNAIGRELDKARQTPNIGQIAIQTPGGSNIDIASMVEQFVGGMSRPLPFEVGLVKIDGNQLQVTIAEGRIFGRADWGSWAGAFVDGINIGASGFNPTYAGPWSDASSTKPEPEQTTRDSSKSTPTGNGTKNTPDKPGVPLSNLPNGGKGSYYSNNPKYKSGNAGSITGNTGNTFHNGLMPSNFANKSGNAGSVTGKTYTTTTPKLSP